MPVDNPNMQSFSDINDLRGKIKFSTATLIPAAMILAICAYYSPAMTKKKTLSYVLSIAAVAIVFFYVYRVNGWKNKISEIQTSGQDAKTINF